VDGAAALGMRRLSIVDLATGHQPVRNEDGSVWTVFNGEIYNFKELRARLVAGGHQFYTTTDTEVIVHLYEEYGRDLVDHLRGMFTIAVWDVRKRQLLLARDRMGIKPLFYAHIPGGLAFASELKALLQLPDVDPELSWPAVGHLLTFLSTPADQSIVAGVQKLQPAHRGVLMRDGRFHIDRYWDAQFEPDPRMTEIDARDRLRELLQESVELHMQSDVPVGAFLSGGVDSSAVVASMSRTSPGRIKTFSIGFSEPGYDESEYAAAVARRFNTEHHTLMLEPQGLEAIEEMAWFLDEPFGDSSAIPTLMVSKLAAEHVKVVLTGDGGDELFAGYDKYVVEQSERKYDHIPAPFRRAIGAVGRSMADGMRGRNFLQHIALDPAERYLDASTLFRRADQSRLLTADAFDQVAESDPYAHAMRVLRSPQPSWLASLQYLDFQHYLPLDILTKVDRMSMAHSIESRPALLDHRLVEFAATIPDDLRLRGTTTKYLFKTAMKGILPDDIISRPKRGFRVPLASWFRGDWSGYVRDLLLSDRSRQRGIFDLAYVETLIRRHERGRPLDLHLWTLMSLELWCRTFRDTARARQRQTVAPALKSRPLTAPVMAAV
jgi:asparagine synthase (glutamine-hydrolysing)